MADQNGRGPRLQIPVTDRLRQTLREAAERTGSDLNTWVLAHAVKAARTSVDGSPLIINADLAHRLRVFADRCDVTPERAVEMLLVSHGDGEG